MNKKIVLGITIILLIIGGVSYSDYMSKKEIRRTEQNLKIANQNLEDSKIGSIKAWLKLYYVTKGEYPSVISEMKEIEQKEASYSTLEERVNSITNFKYEVRGDRQAYKITYTNQKGENIVVEGNYKSDYQNYDK